MGQRQSLILFYARLNQEPARVVYAPAVYADLLQQVYAELAAPAKGNKK